MIWQIEKLIKNYNIIFYFIVHEYIESLTEYPTLLDKLKYKDYSLENNKDALYPAHLTPTQIHDGIKDGTLLQGTFLASRENYLEGYVNVEGYEKFVSILK